MLCALGGEKSPIGGICNSSGAAHLNRKPLREVRSPFFFIGNWSGRAVNLQGCTLLFWNFFLLCKEKSALYPRFGEGKRVCARRGIVCGFWCVLPPLTAYGGALPKGEPFGTPRRRPLQGGMEFVRGGFRRKAKFRSKQSLTACGGAPFAQGSLSGRRDVVPYPGKWSSCAEGSVGEGNS